jgi:hypothetical protein
MVTQSTRSALLCRHFISCSNLVHIYNVGGKIHVDVVVKAHQPYKIYSYVRLCSLRPFIKVSVIIVTV